MSEYTLKQTITNVSQLYTMSVYFVLLIGGLAGNVFNIMVFSSLKIFRRNQCAFYLKFGSIVNFTLLSIALPFSITEFGFNFDLTRLSVIWCKLRQGIVPTVSLLSFSVVCFAAVDQYFSTNYIPWLRRLSSLALAHRLAIIALVLCSLYSILLFILFDLQSTLGCIIYNIEYSRMYSILHLFILSGILPITVSGCSALLAFCNVRRVIRYQVPVYRRRLERQLTAMIIAKVIFLVITTTPFLTFRIYQFNRTPIHKSDNTIEVAIEQLALNITKSLFYLNSAGTFYIFLLTSKRFRQQAKHVLTKCIRKKVVNIMKNFNVFNHQVFPACEGIDIDLE